MLAALAFWSGRRLALLNRADPRRSRRLWAWGLAALGVSSLAGGTFHGLKTALSPPAGIALWKATVYGIGLMDLLLLSASLTATATPRWRRLGLAAAALKSLLFAAWMAGHDAFRYVIYDYAPSLIAILLLQTLTPSRSERASGWIAAGVAISTVAAGVQALGLAPHPRFNHNDLYHVIQMGGIYALCRGGRHLRDR